LTIGTLILETLQRISTVLGLDHIATVPYYSEAEFSMHDLLELLIELTGPASVKITSFSITEVAIRAFHRLSDERKITDLKCIFDHTVRMHRLGLLFFALNVTSEIALTKNHAKIILIENDEWKLTVISSANFNVNDKIEAGIVTGCSDIYYYYLRKFEETFQKSIIVDQNVSNA
jgi:HKD family nuclease